MTTNKTDKNAANLPSKQILVAPTNIASKPLHQHFSGYLLAILLIVGAVLSSALWLSFQQAKLSQALISEQLVPLQRQLIQQSYLSKANKTIDEILKKVNTNDVIALQQELALQSKKLSLLQSQYKNTYQQWFTQNHADTSLITRIESNQLRNIQLKAKSLIQLDTLLDALTIQVENQDIDSNKVQLLTELHGKLTKIVTLLTPLSLHTSLEAFEQLRQQIDEVFIADYAKKLASQQHESQSMADIVRDLIHFEDLTLTAGLLSKWQGNLRLMADYQQERVSQQQKLRIILADLLENSQVPNSTIHPHIAADKETITAQRLPIWQWLIFATSLVSIFVLLWLVRVRIKLASQYSVNCITRALDGEFSQLNIKDKSIFMQFYQHSFHTEESEQLINKIVKTYASNYSEQEYLALSDKNQQLAGVIVNHNAVQEKLNIELERIKLNASKKYQAQLLLEQQRGKVLYLAAIKQLVLLGRSAITSSISTSHEGEPGNYLHYAHLQGRDLALKLRQASCYRYLQSSDAVLTLSDVNLVGQIQAILFNLDAQLYRGKNKLRLNIDKKILAEVNLDAELFAEMFAAFIQLLLSKQIDRHLELNLRLVDKNNGQQKICFSGQVKGGDKIEQLPQVLHSFIDEEAEQNELSQYFKTLLHYQHGDNVSANLAEQGYQFSFTLPLAITKITEQKSYPVLSLPGYAVGIEKSCLTLAAKYLVMPIEVLLAVQEPIKYQRLQQLLQAIGLQITFVSCALMLEKNWQSGRFAILLTEIDCLAFTSFLVDEGEDNSGQYALTRGVFSLASSVGFSKNPVGYAHWLMGRLNADSSVDELITAMQPWLKEQVSSELTPNNKAQLIPGKVLAFRDKQDENIVTAAATDSPSFDFDQYLQHQGSAELALYMIEEYTTENSQLVAKLSHAFSINDAHNADSAIQALQVNGKILAADNLLHLCQHWQQLLNNKNLDNSEQIQIILLSKTKQAVQAISQYADAIV